MEITREKVLREENKILTAELDEVKSELEHALEKWRIAQGTAMERKKKIEKLEKKLEEVDVDFMRVKFAQEVEQLREILDACEAANFKHLQRIEQLEQLCRDMYRLFAFVLDGKPGELAAQADLAKSIHDRMVSYDLILDEWKKGE